METFQYWERKIEELEKRVKALEQEPCTDAVSRETVKEQMIKYGFRAPDMTVTEFVEDLLPVTQKSDNKYRKEAKRWKNKWLKSQKSGKWIPVSERLPEEEIDVLVCNSNGEIEISAGTYSTEVNDFMWYTSGWKFGKVTAWMPLPKSYEPQESEE